MYFVVSVRNCGAMTSSGNNGLGKRALSISTSAARQLSAAQMRISVSNGTLQKRYVGTS